MPLLVVTPDPSVVAAGWIPLVLVLVLGLVMVVLYRSLRKQMRKINIPEEGVPTHGDVARRDGNPGGERRRGSVHD